MNQNVKFTRFCIYLHNIRRENGGDKIDSMSNKRYSFKLDAAEGHRLKDGSYPVALVIRKEKQRKMIYLGISAAILEARKKDGSKEIKSQWNETYHRYELDGRKELHPDRFKLNGWLDELSGRCEELLKDFDKKKVDWTLNQFESALLNKSKKTGVESYFSEHIDKLSRAGKIGNKACYENCLHILKEYDSRFGKLIFNELDLKYIKDFHDYLQIERKNKGNTIKYYMKTLRSLLNKAIKDGEASATTYPFGKNGYSVAELAQETEKRYLPSEYLEKLKTAELDSYTKSWARNLFLFSYYCQGMSFVDMANLTTKNILVFEGGKYIAYRRQKTESKSAKIIRIKITEHVQGLLYWFRDNTHLIEGYLLPIVSKDGFEGQELYDHIRNRFKKLNIHLKKLAEELKFEGVKLTSYVSRHSYAMRLKNSGIPEDVISEALGHKDLATTKVYLDSFGNDEIANANEYL